MIYLKDTFFSLYEKGGLQPICEGWLSGMNDACQIFSERNLFQKLSRKVVPEWNDDINLQRNDTITFLCRLILLKSD